ncbi:hypothetical protein A5893_13080 [Pedobacter psychrophilus]|uniref:Secretion system C-terminal sorting domain-containing protein n=1 Tax=Pedobacter psychrophilus TaxID=1826909 RepID=A0A179DD45_9SPHI|nr:T9SS type A sorting domain-containing protein [Pedobacter psychrophilus]OAQ38965.1 hypothetical protein A5893_13080 [Pedobacter psychrophilus]
MYRFYPNPVDQTLTITTNKAEKELKLSKNTYIDVTLYSDKAKIVYQLKNTADKQIEISTKELPEGIYYLHIKEGEKVEKKQIVIKH